MINAKAPVYGPTVLVAVGLEPHQAVYLTPCERLAEWG